MNPDLSKFPLCDQEWDAMERLDDGRRLCARCQHPVADFRGMSKAEIVLAHAFSDERVCGVYSPAQLAPVDASTPRPGRFRSGLVTLTLGASLLAARAQAQTADPPAREQAQRPPGAQPPPAPTPAQAAAPARAEMNDTIVVIRGTVRDTQGQPLRDAVVIVGEDRRAMALTDAAGGYVLRVRVRERTELQIRAMRIGQVSARVTVDTRRDEITHDFTLKPDEIMMLGIVVTSSPDETRREQRREELRRVGYSVSRIEPRR
jgi:hypothetical protein